MFDYMNHWVFKVNRRRDLFPLFKNCKVAVVDESIGASCFLTITKAGLRIESPGKVGGQDLLLKGSTEIIRGAFEGQYLISASKSNPLQVTGKKEHILTIESLLFLSK